MVCSTWQDHWNWLVVHEKIGYDFVTKLFLDLKVSKAYSTWQSFSMLMKKWFPKSAFDFPTPSHPMILGTMIGQLHWGVVLKPMILRWSCSGWKRTLGPWRLSWIQSISQSSPNVSFQVSNPSFFLDPKDCSKDTFVQAFAYGIAAANLFFSTLRQYGVWVPEPDRSVVVDAGHQMLDLQFESNLLISMIFLICECNVWSLRMLSPLCETCKEAFSYLATRSFHEGLKLFRLRPKIHFQAHLTLQLALGKQGFNIMSF